MSGEQRFWETLDLLIGHESRRGTQDDVHDWAERVVRRHRDAAVKRPQRSMVTDGESTLGDVVDDGLEEEVKRFFGKLRLPPIECTFSHPHVRARLEKLMGSNIVRLLNREYMQLLQERILEDYALSMQERIESREAEEGERVKNLVLSGKIPLDNAPASMADHPVMLIEMYCRRLIAERRSKIREPKVQIPTHLYWDDTPDPPSGLSIEKGHIFRPNQEKLCVPPETYLVRSDQEDAEKGYMFYGDELNKYVYKPDTIMDFRESRTVDEMYQLADEIIGPLKTVDESTRAIPDDNQSVATTFSIATANPPAEEDVEEEAATSEALTAE